MDNKAIAAVFREMAELLDIQGGERYRARTFRRVSHILEELAEPVAEAMRFGALQRRRGIGEGTIARIKEILRTGTCRDLERLRARMPSAVRELLQLDGLGPKSVRLIYTHLGVGSIDELEAAARSGRLTRVPRIGAGAAERILRAIADHRRRVDRTPLAEALRVGEALVQALAAHPAVLHVELAGSARRRRDTVGDLDLLVATLEPKAVAGVFCALPEVADVLLRGTGRTSVRLTSGQRVDLRLLDPDTFGAGLHYFTGSKRHNIAIRVRGNRRGLKISEYGIFTRADERRLAGGAEVDVFAAVGLPYIPPELREDDGEIEAAERGALPRLLEEGQLRGDLNVHTRASDGQGSIRAMAEAAAALELGYLAITDHARGIQAARGLDLLGLLAQARKVRRLDGRIGDLRLLAGVEVEILPDGTLGLAPDVLARLDWVVASVHCGLEGDAEAMTARLVRAMESGVVDCIGHPTGRLLGRREPAALDWGRLLHAARRLGVALELNASPLRLDLDAGACRQARDAGVAVAISSGAHAPEQLAQRRLGVYTARRGWLEARHVLNAGPLERLQQLRRDRLRRVAIQVPDGLPPGERSELDLLRRALAAPPLSAEVQARLEAWLRDPDDPVVARALAELSDNPVAKAFELLWEVEKRPQARVEPEPADEEKEPASTDSCDGCLPRR
jgi:DNA polymerase (family 10)